MIRKIKISSPKYDSIQRLKADVDSTTSLSNALEESTGVGLDFNNFSVLCNGKPLEAGDPLPNKENFTLEVSEKKNASGK